MKSMFDTRAVNSWKYEFLKFLGLSAVIRSETVKAAEKSSCDTWVLNSWRHEILKIIETGVIR